MKNLMIKSLVLAGFVIGVSAIANSQEEIKQKTPEKKLEKKEVQKSPEKVKATPAKVEEKPITSVKVTKQETKSNVKGEKVEPTTREPLRKEEVEKPKKVKKVKKEEKVEK